MFAPSPPPNRCQKMTSAVFGCAPVKLEPIGDAQPDSAAASAAPPPAARNWRRDSPVMRYLEWWPDEVSVATVTRRVSGGNRGRVDRVRRGRRLGASRVLQCALTRARDRRRTSEQWRSPRVRATQQDGSYPRPMLCREAWTSLDGTWQFAHDDARIGVAARWFAPSSADAFEQSIEVPYPPESPASTVGERGFHPDVWYRRVIGHDVLTGDGGSARRVLVHFGAVDHRAQVWFDGQLVVEHVGGQTPFTADLTDALATAGDQAPAEHVLVVRAEDDPHALHQPRGKQDWREKPHSIWYERTTGIWQSVWLETVPVQAVEDVAWTFYASAAVVRGEVTLTATPASPLGLEVTLRLGEEVLGEVSCV